MLDKLIRAGAGFDWITPVITFILDYQRRPSVGYNIPVDAGWSAYSVRALLDVHGVKLWGLTIFDNVITFRTRLAQAQYAQYLMEREGIPYDGGIQDASRAKLDERPQRLASSRWAQLLTAG